MRFALLVKIGIVLVVVVALVVGGIFVAIRSIDLEQIKAVLTSEVTEATGRTLAIAGPLEIKLGLFPSVVAQGVTYANPAGSTRSEMARIGRLEMEIDLMPLLERQIVVKRLLLAAPDILIETEAQGPGNLDFTRSRKSSETKPTETKPLDTNVGAVTVRDSAYRVHIEEVRITGGQLAWYDRTAKKTESLAIGELSLKPDTSNRELLTLRLRAKLREQAIDVNGTIGGPEIVLAEKPWPLRLQANVSGIALQVEGSVADLSVFRGLKLNIGAQGGELMDAVRMVGLSKTDLLKGFGPFKLTATLNDTGKRLNLADVVLAAGKADLLQVQASGVIKDLSGTAILDLAMQLVSDNPAAAANLAGVKFTGKGPIKLAGQLHGSGNSWKVSGIKASAGDSDLSGELAAQLGARWRLTGKLISSVLHPAELTSQPVPVAQTAAETPLPPTHRSKVDYARVFPDEPFPVAPLRIVDADLGVQIDKLILKKHQLTDVAARLQLNGGKLTVPSFRFALGGGVVEGSARVDVSGKVPIADLNIQGRQVEIGKLDSEGPISGGKSDLQVDVKASGETMRALMATVTGEARLSVGEGTLRGRTMDMAAGDLLVQVLGAINPFAKSEGTTQMNCAAVRLVLRDGIATADKGIALRTSKVDVVGSGTIDLRSEKIDLDLKPRTRGGLGISLSTPLAGLIKATGTLADPAIGIDPAGTLRTAASVGVGFATGGLSALGEVLLDKVTADDDPCRTALGQPKQRPAKGK